MRRPSLLIICGCLGAALVAFGCSDSSSPSDASTARDQTRDQPGDTVTVSEGGKDPCAACGFDEVCVHSFDGTCTDLGVACKKVDPICAHRTFPLGTPSSPCELGAWNDGGAPDDGWNDPECDKQYCGASLQCDNGSPCGSEHPTAQVYCYGP